MHRVYRRAVERFLRLGTITIIGICFYIADDTVPVDDESRWDWELPATRLVYSLNIQLEYIAVDILQVIREGVDQPKGLGDLVIDVR